MTLTFDEATHEYHIDGVLVPHVTAVLESERIIDYSKVEPSVLQAAKLRGHYVHMVTAFDDDGDLDHDSVHPSIAGYLQAWWKFRRETGFKPTLIEQHVYSPTYGFAGTLDRLGRMGGETILVDIKSGPILDGAAFQTAAYALCVEEIVDRRIAVRLNDNATYTVRTFEGDYDEEIFLAALSLYKWRHNYGK